MTASTPVDRTGVDLGRVAVVVLFVLTAVANGTNLARTLSVTTVRWRDTTESISSLLALAFCLLVVRAYLRRGRARATDRGKLVWVVAPVATALPLVLAAVPPRPSGAARTAASLSLTVAGLLVSVLALRCLSDNLSVVPQARAAVVHGPYRWVRHPLYLGEILTVVGLAIHLGRWSLATPVVLQVVLQGYRARREESLLRQKVAGYAGYADRTALLLPGLW